jgi:hypothetical protein
MTQLEKLEGLMRRSIARQLYRLLERYDHPASRSSGRLDST